MNVGSGGAYSSAATPTAPQGAAMPFNDAAFRLRLTDTAQSTQLSISAIRDNTYQRFTIAADYSATYNVYSALSAAPIGWNKTAKGSADVVIDSGVVVGTPSTATYAMDTGPAPLWPGPSTITVINNGYIIGHGGNGGAGGDSPGGAGAGTSGGPALRAQRAMKLENTGTVGGGGGGGGGAPGTSTSFTTPPPVPPTAPSYPTSPGPITTFNRYGGGAGGGGRTARTPTAGGTFGNATGPGNLFDSNAGSPGTFAAAGAGSGGPGPAGAGGTGGDWGTAGAPGAPGVQAGGAAGISVQGWSLVTYTSGPAPAPTGTISGPSTAG